MNFIDNNRGLLNRFIIVCSLVISIILIVSCNIFIPTAANAATFVNRDSKTEEYIASFGEIAREVAQERDLYASVMIAQAILESGSGTSELSKAPNFNQFGIKGVWTDEVGNKHSVTYKTMEDDGTGNKFETTASFRAYNSIYDSIVDYANLLTDTNYVGKAYKGTWKSNAKNYKQACAALEGNYASATDYSSRLTDTIELYDLTKYDIPNNFEIDGSMYEPNNPTADPLTGDRPLLNSDYTNVLGIALSKVGCSDVTCGSLVRDIYNDALGYNIPETLDEQQYNGIEVQLNDLRPCDLVFFSSENVINNVGIYIGNGYYIHVPETGGKVCIDSFNDASPIFAKRILKFIDKAPETPEQSYADSYGKRAAEFLVNNPFETKQR